MNATEIDNSVLSQKAIGILKDFFNCINFGHLEAARSKLFHPPGSPQKTLFKHVDRLAGIAPFENIECSISRIGDFRMARHGEEIASIWVDVDFSCALGSFSTYMIVWLFSKNGEMKIASRLDQLVIMAKRLSEDQ